MSVINTNLLSLTSQSKLSRSQNQLGAAMERLASGLRVNSSKDDAAGQAIGNRFQAQVTGLNQAARNANDGISLSQTAQGVLNQINDKLHRIRELTVQGLSEIYNGEMGDRIQAEINLGLQEIDRLVETSHYNGIPLLDGSAGTIPLQVGASDGQVLGVDLGKPGFSVEQIGLLNMTFQGEPGTVTPINTLSGSSNRVPIDSELTTLNYVPSENNPNLVTGTAGSPTRPTLIQYSGETGRLHNYTRSVNHDTDTLKNTVRFSTTTTEYPRTAGEFMSSLTYLDENGSTLTLNSSDIVRFDNKLWIQEQVSSGQYRYLEAELTIKGNQNSVVAQVIPDTSVVIKEAPIEVPLDGLVGLRYSPTVEIASSQYSVEVDGGDETSNNALTLVRLGSRYYIEEKLGEDNYAYYKADVTIKTGGEENIVDVVTARTASRKLVVEDQPYTSGNSIIHLKPGNNNVKIDYVDSAGRRHENVMRPDGEGGYVFNINEFTNAPGANKTAKVVVNQDGQRLLQTFNGMGEVILYYPMSVGSTTNVENNSTQLTLYEDGPAQRIRSPAKPLAVIDEAIAQVDKQRSQLGALENRLGSLVESNQLTATNLSAAQSRIMDADYAVESANMVKAQILQQAGNSVLAQANAMPEIVLALIE